MTGVVRVPPAGAAQGGRGDRGALPPALGSVLASAALAALVVAGGLVPPTGPAAAQEVRLSGENGLWVREREGRVHVAWLTDTAGPGLLEVLQDGRRAHRVETPTSQAHAGSFPRSDGARLVLRYGLLAAGDGEDTEGGGLHRTVLDLDASEPPPPAVLEGVDSLFVVGDVHGRYETLVELLRNAGLVDAGGRWTGGGRHVVFLGDLLDRGDDVTRTLWFLYRLEREARAAGGGAHVVLGNHEIMVFTDDLRYVAPKERLVAQLHGTTPTRLLDVRESVLGRWLSGRPGLMKVDGVLLAHGGVGPDYARWGVEAFNDSLATFMAEDLFYHLAPILDPTDSTAVLVTDSALVDRVEADQVVVMDPARAQRVLDFFFAEGSVFWFRGYVDPGPVEDSASASLAETLGAVLEHHGASVHVVGHTPVPTVESRFGGRLVATDMADAASEMLLLVRTAEGGYEAWRYGLEGLPERLPLPP